MLCHIPISWPLFLFLKKERKEKANSFSWWVFHTLRTLAWRIPWTEEPGRLQSMGSRRVRQDTTEWLHFHFSLSCIGEGNGNPLQCSFLENPRDEGAWWAAVCGVAKSRTRLKQVSSSSIRLCQSWKYSLWNKCSSLQWHYN